MIGLSVIFLLWRRKAKSRTATKYSSRIGAEPETEQRKEKTSGQPTLAALDLSKKANGTVSETPKNKKNSKPIGPYQFCDTMAGALSGGELDPKLREFMEGIVARIREEASRVGEDIPIDMIEELVDRVDELKLIDTKDSETNAKAVSAFLDGIVKLLEVADVELLHSESWNPEIQRALSKTPTPGISRPTIISFVSTGLSKSSKLIRKQEVILAVPLQPQP